MSSMHTTTVSERLSRKLSRNVRERAIELVLFLAASVSVLTTIGIIWILIFESYHFFEHVPVWDFLTDTMWTPLFSTPRYGILPLLLGTVTTSLVALAVAVPLGTVIAIYISEFASPRVREIVKPFLELLGGVPTIVYGYFALTVVSPVLQYFFPSLPGFSMLAAGLVMGIAIVPYISSLSEDAMRAVPMSLREGAYAMGSTRFQTAVRVVLPAAISGVLSATSSGFRVQSARL